MLSYLLAVILASAGAVESSQQPLAGVETTIGPSAGFSESATLSKPVPWLSGSLPPRTRRKVIKAFTLAADRVREEKECRRLFERQGVDGAITLSSLLFYGTSLVQERSLCRGHVAFCMQKSRVVYLCRSFGHLPDRQAARILLHEALHSAGVGERPVDSSSLDPCEINDLIRKCCGL